MASAPLTLRDLNRATLARQMLLGRERIKPLRAIERLVGLQAQWPEAAARGAVVARPGLRERRPARPPAQREAVRATMMRGTLHIVSARDYVALRQPPAADARLARCSACCAGGRRASTWTMSSRSPEQHLGSGAQTFEQVRDALASRYPKADRRAMGFIARCSLPLVQTPTDRPRVGVPLVAALRARGGLARRGAAAVRGAWTTLVLRYLAAFGPADGRPTCRRGRGCEA